MIVFTGGSSFITWTGRLFWTQYVGADCILIANDSVPNDDLRKTTIKMAKPPAVKLVIKNIADSIEAIKSGVTDKYKLLLLLSPWRMRTGWRANYPTLKALI